MKQRGFKSPLYFIIRRTYGEVRIKLQQNESIEDGLKFIKDGGIDYFKLIKQLNINNFILRFPSMFSDKSITKKQSEEIRAEKIPFFFNDYVDKWDVLYGYFDLGAKAVYIANELGFELDKVHEMAAQHSRLGLVRLI